MTQEDKELLMKDLCARLPYETKCAICGASGTIMKDKETIFYTPWPNIITFEGYERNKCYMYWQVKPYLRPMSSMTEEENKEFDIITNGEKGFYEDEDGWIRCDNIHTKWGVWPKGCAEMIDWLNAHHFDYRGLIENGLALEAPEDMYKTE